MSAQINKADVIAKFQRAAGDTSEDGEPPP